MSDSDKAVIVHEFQRITDIRDFSKISLSSMVETCVLHFHVKGESYNKIAIKLRIKWFHVSKIVKASRGHIFCNQK